VLLEPTTWAWLFFASEWLVRLAALVTVPSRRAPAEARSWLLIIFIEPWAGLALFLLLGNRRLPRRRRRRLAELPSAFAAVRERLRGLPNIVHPDLGPELAPAVRLAENLGHLPILDGGAAEVLVDYGGVIDRLVGDIDAADHHVHLAFYIFAADRTARRVIDALARAVRRGVRCRVLVDSLGSRRYLRALLPELAAAGVEAHEVLPVGLLRWRLDRIDLRNHRKIAVIDGRTGYTGSQNLVDAAFKEGLTYEELMVRATGPVVLELQFVFAADWFLETGQVLDGTEVFPEPVLTGDVPSQVLPSGPGFPTANNQRFFVALIHGARERVVITTPYFIPDGPLLQALQTAVLRGVEVHLIVSERADQFLVGHAQRSYYGELLDAGVSIHEYRRNFLHAKHISIDGRVAIVGSSNMDIRSFALNDEISLLIYHPGLAGRLRLEEGRYLRSSRRLDPEGWARRPLRARTLNRVARLFSPLL
jgi:cardiolipin synthase A/B